MSRFLRVLGNVAEAVIYAGVGVMVLLAALYVGWMVEDPLIAFGVALPGFAGLYISYDILITDYTWR